MPQYLKDPEHIIETERRATTALAANFDKDIYTLILRTSFQYYFQSALNDFYFRVCFLQHQLLG